MKKQILLVLAYLVAIVTANLLVNQFGALITIPVGFLLVGLDITGRDHLHEMWQRHRWLKMGALIGCGSLLSWLLNRSSSQIAIASFAAFAVSEILDTIVYTVLRKRSYLVKVNGSNVLSSLADSSLFLTIAFGSFMPLLILSQFFAKFVGGFVWSLVLRRTTKLKEVAL